MGGSTYACNKGKSLLVIVQIIFKTACSNFDFYFDWVGTHIDLELCSLYYK